MSVPVLEAIADAIYAFEGNRAGQRAYQNRNPGNLRATDPTQAQDKDGYRVFASFCVGYDTLLDDLRAKVTGHNTHGLSLASNLLSLLKVYAPAADGNKPLDYSVFVANQLWKAYGTMVSPYMTFRVIYEDVAKQELPDGVESP